MNPPSITAFQLRSKRKLKQRDQHLHQHPVEGGDLHQRTHTRRLLSTILCSDMCPTFLLKAKQEIRLHRTPALSRRFIARSYASGQKAGQSLHSSWVRPLQRSHAGRHLKRNSNRLPSLLARLVRVRGAHLRYQGVGIRCALLWPIRKP